MPKGMPMMVIISNSEETKYSTAMPNPPKMSQTMFHHTKENMQIFLTIKFNFVLLPIE